MAAAVDKSSAVPSLDSSPDPTGMSRNGSHPPLASTSTGTPGSVPSTAAGPSSTTQRRRTDPPLARGSACTICRKRKLKCDGAKPACGTCVRLKHECVYGDPAHEKLQDRNRELQKRVEQLEAELATYREANGVQSPNGAPLSTHSSYEVIGASVPSQQSVWSASPFPTDSPLFPIPAVDGTQLNMDQFSVLGGVAIPSDLGKAAGIEPFPPTPTTGGPTFTNFPNVSPPTQDLMASGWSIGLPPIEVVLDLTDIYFRTMGLHLPFLHRPRFVYSIHHPASLHSGPSLSLIYAVIAVAALYHDDPQIRSRSSAWYDRSREKVAEAIDGSLGANGIAKGTLTVETVQAICILTSIDMGRNDHQRAFIGIGSAMRACVMLGLHRMDEDRIASIEGTLRETRLRPPALHRLPDDPLLLEECRRTMCAVFALDRCQSACLGWPNSIHEGDMRILLPCSDQRFGAGTCLIDGQDNPLWWPVNESQRQRELQMSPISSFAWLCRALWLGGRIQRQTYRPLGNPWPGPLHAPARDAPLNDVERVLETDQVLHEIRSQVTSLASKNAQKGVDVPLVMVLVILNCLSINLHHLRVTTLLSVLPFDPSRQIMLGSGEYSLQQCLEACRALLEIVTQISAFENVHTALHQSRVGIYSTFLPYIMYCFAFPAKWVIADWNLIATNRTVNSGQQGGIVPSGNHRIPPGDAVFGPQFDDFRLDFVDAVCDVLDRLAIIWPVGSKFSLMVRNDKALLMSHLVERRKQRSSPEYQH